MSDINDFMFIWDMMESEIDKELILREIILGVSTAITVMTPRKHRVIISNKDCKINGYNELIPTDFGIDIRS